MKKWWEHKDIKCDFCNKKVKGVIYTWFDNGTYKRTCKKDDCKQKLLKFCFP